MNTLLEEKVWLKEFFFEWLMAFTEKPLTVSNFFSKSVGVLLSLSLHNFLATIRATANKVFESRDWSRRYVFTHAVISFHL